MAESQRDLEVLSRRYAELGFDLSGDEIEKFVPRIEQVETALDAVRSIEASGHEGVLTFVPRRAAAEQSHG